MYIYIYICIYIYIHILPNKIIIGGCIPVAIWVGTYQIMNEPN